MPFDRFRLLVAFIALVLFAPLSAGAQWSLSKTFQAPVRSIFFLDQQGSSNTGFVGLDNSTIWFTVDNGVTWTQAATPTSSFIMQVTDFAFRNGLQGWCSLRSANSSTGAIWMTTDGGQTWVWEDTVLAGAVSIAYCNTTGVLVASCWLGTSITSSDYGVTWTSFAPSYMNGATFIGNLGFIGIFNTALTPLYSANGGMNWNNATGIKQETWAPWGIPGTSIVAAAAEKTRQIFISANGGATWTNPYTFPISEVPTGCIRGNQQNLFIQTGNAGMYCSTDVGNTWFSICGPTNALDTRFYSKGRQVFAADGLFDLWYIPDALAGANATLTIDRVRLSYSGVRCLSYDSILHLSCVGSCQSGVLDSVLLLSGSNFFRILPGSVPRVVSSSDSIDVQYNPGPSSTIDSGKLKLVFNLGTQIVDTIITLVGIAKSSSSYSHDPSLDLTARFACEENDSEVFIHNYSCDSLQITSISISDTSHFRLKPDVGIKTLAPGKIDTIPIQAFSNQAGIFTTELQFRLIAGGTIHISDSLPMTLNVIRSGAAEIGALDLSAIDGCEPIDTVLSIIATPCDSVTLMLAQLSDTSVFHPLPSSLPAIIPAGNVFNLAVHVVPGSAGTYSTLLHVRYQSGASVIDTLVTLTLNVRYNVPARLNIVDTLVSMGTVNVPCASSSRWITLGNSACKTLKIDSLVWENASQDYTFDPVSLPVTLAKESGIDSIRVHFDPSSVDTSSNRLHIHFEVNGVPGDTAITISGIGISSFHDSVLTSTLQFDTILSCQADTLIGKIVNLSCDSIIAISGTIPNLNYTILSPVFPVAFGSGDTLEVQVQLPPGKSGNVSDAAVIVLHDSVDGKDHPETITLTGYARPTVHSLSITNSQFSFSNIAPCSFADSSFAITNTGTCDDILLIDTSLTGTAGVVLSLPSALPLTLPPDSSIRISFRVTPNDDTIRTATLSLSGTNIDTLIHFAFSELPGGKAIALSYPDSIFITKPCVPISKTFWIANVGCEAVPIDSIVVNGSGEFSIGNLPSAPAVLPPGDTLFYSVQYTPGSSGSANANLTVISRDVNYSRTIPLSGSVNGTVPSARVAFQMNGAPSALPGDTVSASLLLLDDIGDSTDLHTVSFTLNTNWDVLALAKIVTSVGWTVADTAWNKDGSLTFRLRDTGSGNIAGNSILATCYFKTYVSDSSNCQIQMSNLAFNDADASYERCTLSSISVPTSIPFTERDTCGSPILRSSMEGELGLRIISVQPNPAPRTGNGTHFDLTLRLAEAGTVQISITDMLGREAWHGAIPCQEGSQTIPLELPALAEGPAFVKISNSNGTDSRKVIIEN